MQQKQNKGAVLKGLAFPIGYFIFMNVFQIITLSAYAFYCVFRDMFIPIASAANDPGHFAQLLSDSVNSPAFEHYISESLMTELVGAPTYFLSTLTSILAIVILWFVFNRKNRDFKEYFGFKPTSFRAIAAAVLLGLGFYFLVNAVLTVISIVSNLMLQEWLIPTLRNLTDQMLQSGRYDLADALRDLADTIETTLNSPTIVPPLGWFALAAIIFAPLVEEIVFRAGAITNFRKKLPMAATILLSSALFSLAHIGSLNFSQLIYTFILGAVAALLYVWTDSIYPAIVCHFCFNGANIVSLMLYKLFSLDFVESTPSGNHFFGNAQFVTPNADNLVIWCNLVTLGYLFITALLSIPMLSVGIILLIKLRPAKKKSAAPVQTTPVHTAPASQALTADGPQVIAAEPSLCEQTETSIGEQTDGQQAPAEEAPVAEAPTEETPAEEPAVEETPVEETPVEEAPVEEAPANAEAATETDCEADA